MSEKPPNLTVAISAELPQNAIAQAALASFGRIARGASAAMTNCGRAGKKWGTLLRWSGDSLLFVAARNVPHFFGESSASVISAFSFAAQFAGRRQIMRLRPISRLQGVPAGWLEMRPSATILLRDTFWHVVRSDTRAEGKSPLKPSHEYAA
jgi:hypothetical protein